MGALVPEMISGRPQCSTVASLDRAGFTSRSATPAVDEPAGHRHPRLSDSGRSSARSGGPARGSGARVIVAQAAVATEHLDQVGHRHAQHRTRQPSSTLATSEVMQPPSDMLFSPIRASALGADPGDQPADVPDRLRGRAHRRAGPGRGTPPLGLCAGRAGAAPAAPRSARDPCRCRARNSRRSTEPRPSGRRARTPPGRGSRWRSSSACSRRFAVWASQRSRSGRRGCGW